MGIKSRLKNDLDTLVLRLNAERKEEGKPPLNVRFKGSEILINIVGKESTQVKMDLDLIIYKLVNGEDGFGFFMAYLKQFDFVNLLEDMNWETCRHFIYPMLKSEKSPMEFGESNPEGNSLLIRESPIPFTKVFFVIDDDHQMMYVTSKMISDLGITEETLIEEAYLNMKNKFGFDLVEGEVFGVRSFKSDTHDGFDATRILNLDLKSLTEKVGDNYYVVIPERDMLLIVESPKTKRIGFLETLSTIALKGYNSSRYEVSPKVYQWNGEELVVIK